MKDNIEGIIEEPIKLREDDEEQTILDEARKRAAIGYSYHESNFVRAEENVLFIFGEQYSEDDLKDKAQDNRLALTFNKLPQFINKVTGAQRSSVQTIKVTPTGASIGKKEPELETTSGRKLPLSSVLTDLIRDIEHQSNAKAWYKMAFKHALEGGFGWLRVLTEYQQDGFDLDIRIRGIRDRWSVITDPKAVEPDGSDMNWAFVTERISNEEFNKRYPGKSKEAITSNTNSATDTTFWGDEDQVTIAEYFRREPYKKEIVLLSNGETHAFKDIEDIVDELEEDGITIVKRRTTTAYKVIWCKITSGSILEPEIEFPTTTIPLVQMTGRETDLRNKRLTKGLVDDAIDSQIAMNAMKSAMLERVDSSPLAPFIATDKAIEGYEQQWANANSIKYSTLTYKKGEDRPQRDHGSTMPAAEMNVANSLDEDIKSSIGIFNAALGQQSNEISGKAIRARQSEADVGTFEFLDNYQNALRRVGLLCTEIIPTVYDTERIIRIRGEDDSIDTIEINKTVPDRETGKEVVIHDLNFGKHTVVISTGAAYETKREESAAQILDLMKVSPQVAQVGSDILVKNLDFPDSDVLGTRLEKMVPLQFLSKEKQAEIQEDMPEAPPSPEQIKAQAEQEKLQLEMQMKQQELDANIRMEEIKLQVAQTNLQIKQLELREKALPSDEKMEESEEERREAIAENIANNIATNQQTDAMPATTTEPAQ